MAKHNITKRKFYGKWLYKVSLSMPGIAVLRMKGINNTLTFLAELKNDNELKYSYLKRAYYNREDISDLCFYLLSQDKNSWAKRIETSYIDIYTNDISIFDYLTEKFQHILRAAFAPDANRSDDYDNEYHIVCKKLPHDRYRYKVFLRPHKLKNDRQGKLDFISWLDTQKNISISDAVKGWFITTDWNWDRRYILVEDHNTLLMLKLRNAEVVGKIYEYIVSDK